MNEIDRATLAADAAAIWQPVGQLLDHDQRQQARTYYAAGYMACLRALALQGPLANRSYQPLEHERSS
ncbi:MAG: hypothetical protein ACLQIB_40585 [Isosphaeraceae bacterium]